GIKCPGKVLQSALTDNPLSFETTLPFTSPGGTRSTSAYLPVGLTPRHFPLVPTNGSPSRSLSIGRTMRATSKFSARGVARLAESYHADQSQKSRVLAAFRRRVTGPPPP